MTTTDTDLLRARLRRLRPGFSEKRKADKDAANFAAFRALIGKRKSFKARLYGNKFYLLDTEIHQSTMRMWRRNGWVRPAHFDEYVCPETLWGTYEVLV